MRTRMQPVGNAWAKLPRLVRDLAQASGKQIELAMTGNETELDRQILQAIQDPLTHMVRNSADHGIEGAADRRRAGKPEKGTIRLDAYHEGGHIVIEIRDDGKGLDAEAIRRKAVERGLVRAEAGADGMVTLSGNATVEWSGSVTVDLESGEPGARDLVITQRHDEEIAAWETLRNPM